MKIRFKARHFSPEVNSTIGTTKLFPANYTQLVMTPKTLGNICIMACYSWLWEVRVINSVYSTMFAGA